jgi:hypothetical protein
VELPILTVVIPAFNEEATIDELLRRVVAAPYTKQIIVVDDGSKDRTAEIVRRWEDRGEVELLQHATNRGKGAAIRTALEHAQGQFTIIQDADLEYDPQDYARVIQPLLDGSASVVYGSRYFHFRGRAGRARRRLSMLRCGVGLLNWCVRLLYGAKLTDEATCYKAFPTSGLRAMQLECERFEFCPEVTAKACRMGLAIAEVPIRYDPRTTQEGKKFRWRDGLEALWCLWKWRRWKPDSGATPTLAGSKAPTGSP